MRDGKRCDVHMDAVYVERLSTDERKHLVGFCLDVARRTIETDEEAARAAGMSVGDWRRAVIMVAIGRSVLHWQIQRVVTLPMRGVAFEEVDAAEGQ